MEVNISEQENLPVLGEFIKGFLRGNQVVNVQCILTRQGTCLNAAAWEARLLQGEVLQ